MALFDPKTKTIANYQKKIEEDKNQINKNYDEIGRLYYKQYKDINNDVTTDINSRCDAVSRLYEDIEDLKTKILFEKGLKLCPNCRKENNLEYAFCFACGTKFEEVTPVPAVEEAVATEEEVTEEVAAEEEATEAPAEEAAAEETPEA